MKKIFSFILRMSFLFFFASCTKFVEVEPPITSINGENVFDEDQSAIAVLTGVYTNISAANVASTTGWLTNLCFITGLTGDELKLYNEANQQFSSYYTNNISPSEFSTWLNLFKIIFISNSAVEGLPKGKFLSESVRMQLLGEAYFLRGLCYFYLVNLYGEVPLVLDIDGKKNRMLGRSKVEDVYKQVLIDVKKARDLLNSNYVGKDVTSPSQDRVRPNKWTANALLARVSLYIGDYDTAEIESDSIINNSLMYKLENLNSVFKINNQEAIWQLQSVGTSAAFTANTQEGITFNLGSMTNSSEYLVYLNDELVSSFEENDNRKIEWINHVVQFGKVYYYPFKYKLGFQDALPTEASTVFRLGEQFLIRAEARIQKGKIAQGVGDLNTIRKRASNGTLPLKEPLAPLPINVSKSVALLAIESERRHELFAEWGHRWMDLKRTNRIDEILMTSKPNYQPTDKLFPIPLGDILLNPGLKDRQNPGYN